MRAMILDRPGDPLSLREVALPTPARGQIRIKVSACGVCRTDQHIVDGELRAMQLPLIPGHQIVGRVDAVGEGSKRFVVGQLVGVSWLAWTCGECRFCTSGRENLCDAARFTGYHVAGGFAEYAIADERFVLALPDGYSESELAPLLCAGLIGLRALRMTGPHAKRIGLFGFGAAGHLVAQVIRREGRELFAFTRPGNSSAQRLATELGAVWVGGSDVLPPQPLDAAILFASVGSLVPAALRAVDKGGTVVCAGIHMSDIPSFPYEILWNERQVRSVANLTRADGEELIRVARTFPLRAHITPYPLGEANRALDDLRSGRLVGAAVLEI